MELRQSDLNFVCSRIPQDVRRFMVEGRGLMLAGGAALPHQVHDRQGVLRSTACSPASNPQEICLR